MKFIYVFAFLMLAACSSSYNTGGYENLSRSLDNLHETAQKVKDAQNEYKRYNNEGDDYFENKFKENLEERKNEYKQRRDNLKAKSDRLKQDFQDIRDNW